MPGHKDFVGAHGIAEDLGPGACGLVAIGIPERSQIGIELLAVRLKILRELFRDGEAKAWLAAVGVIARVAEDTDFVLHLHHQDGVVAAVCFFDVLHESGKGAGIGFLAGGGEGSENFDLVAVLDDARETPRILLDPDGRVAGHAVFPGGQPQEDDVLVLLARLGEKAIDEGEVECALGGLNQLPVQRGHDGVEVHGCHPGPDGLHEFEAGGGGVADFAAEDEEGLTVDDELGGRAAFFQMRRVVLLRGEAGGCNGREEEEDEQTAEAASHNGRNSSTARAARNC